MSGRGFVPDPTGWTYDTPPKPSSQWQAQISPHRCSK